jgi:hypothetical protein
LGCPDILFTRFLSRSWRSSKYSDLSERVFRGELSVVMVARLTGSKLKHTVNRIVLRDSAKWPNFIGLVLAVSASIFAGKYSLRSIFRDLQGCPTFAPLEIANLRNISSKVFAILLFQNKIVNLLKVIKF